MPQHPDGPHRRLAEECGIVPEAPPTAAHAPPHRGGDGETFAIGAADLRLRVRRKIVARADRRDHAVWIHSLDGNLPRSGVPVERDHERLERRAGLCQRRNVQHHLGSLALAVHPPQVTPRARYLVRAGGSDHDRSHGCIQARSSSSACLRSAASLSHTSGVSSRPAAANWSIRFLRRHAAFAALRCS